MKKVKRILAALLACAVTCAAGATAFALSPFEARLSETDGYMTALNVPGGGLDEWGFIGLAENGTAGDEEAVKEMITAALTELDTNGFDGTYGSGSNLAKLILFLDSQKISPYTFGENGSFAGYDLVKTLFNTDSFYGYVSAYSDPYILMVYDALGISAEEEAGYKYKREDLVKNCLSLIGNIDAAASGMPGATDGMTGVANTFDTTGKSPFDLEATAMVLQALAPYYTGSKPLSSETKAEVDSKVAASVSSLKQLQTATGGISYAFSTYDANWNPSFVGYYESCDALSQIVLAFTALGEDVGALQKDPSAPSMLENLLSDEYKTSLSGEFRANGDPLTDYYVTYYTTKFAYLAMTAYNKASVSSGTAFEGYNIFDAAAPTQYAEYDYSFFYPEAEEDDNDDNSEEDDKITNEDENKIDDPAKTGDSFPFAVWGILILGAAALPIIRKARR